MIASITLRDGCVGGFGGKEKEGGVMVTHFVACNYDFHRLKYFQYDKTE